MIAENKITEDLILSKVNDKRTKRIVMQDGVYDRETMEEPTKY